MEGKNVAKISLSTLFLIFAILVIIVMGVFIYKLTNEKNVEAQKSQELQGQINSLNEKNTLQDEKNNVATKEEEQTSNEIKPEEKDHTDINVKTSDLVTLYCESTNDHCDIFYAFVENGELYYLNRFVKNTMGNSNTYLWFFGNKQEMKKYPNLNNIKKIKSINLGTSPELTPFLITNDGKVYRVEKYTQNTEEIQVTLFDGLKDYKVEDILSHDGTMDYDVWEILLTDGTTKKVTL